MDYPVLVALTVLGLVTVASGLGLLVVGRSRTSACLLVVSGLALVAGSVLEASDRPDIAEPVLVGYVLGIALAVTQSPRPGWRHPADFVALVVVSGCGVLAAGQPHAGEVTASFGIVGTIAVGAHLWWRIERTDPPDRPPLIWLALSVAVAIVVSGLVVFVGQNSAGAAAGALVWIVVPPTMYVAATRPDVVDVRGLVVGVVVVLFALIAYMSLFVMLESLLEVLGGDVPSVGVLAALGAVAALTLHPLQVALRGVVDALLFGVRPDPLGAAAQMADQIGEDPEQALRAIRAALVLPYAALEIDGEVVASSGSRGTHTRDVPLALGSERAGRPVRGALVVGLRAGDLALGDDEIVLRLVAAILAQMLRARALAADLRASRRQLVDSLEDERRRLRRDLHDGLGPRLSGIAFTADAARNSVRTDPDLSEQLLRDLRADTATAISDIRELVYAMRPPALDELGLLGALGQRVSSLRAPDGSPLAVEFRAPALPALTAAVEVAAYRIVVEALTNVARHSPSRSALVSLEPGPDGLRIEVVDHAAANGHREARWTPGVGISGMRERAAEVGGTLTAAPSDAGGRVLAMLPLRPDGM